jgi:hypothetical protein
VNANDIGGFMICKKAKSSRYACELCRQRIEVSGFGQVRMREMEQAGKRMALLCNECGGKAVETITQAAAKPEHPGATLEILPDALEQIADRDPQLAKELFRKDAETREREAKDKKA